ncbi:MAG: hypothetical protein AAGJ46_15790 [Planctomycetota bacterium]
MKLSLGEKLNTKTLAAAAVLAISAAACAEDETDYALEQPWTDEADEAVSSLPVEEGGWRLPIGLLGAKYSPPTGPGFRRVVRILGNAAAGTSRQGKIDEQEIAAAFTPESDGSVHVNFSTSSPFLLVGFRDYGDFEVGPVVEPPGIISGDDVDEFSDAGNSPTVDSPGNVVADVTDYQPDDILPNGGYLIFVDNDPTDGDDFNPAVDVITLDFGDLHNFNIRFDELRLSHRLGLHSFELVGQHLWSRKAGLMNRWPAMRLSYHGQGVAAELGSLPAADIAGPTRPPAGGGLFAGAKSVDYLAYGIRVNHGFDEFFFEGYSDVIGHTSSGTDAAYWAIGPQVSLGQVTAIGRWTFDLSGHVVLAYSRVEIEQDNVVGQDVAPGGYGRPLVVPNPTRTRYEQEHDHFAPHAELRLATSYAVRRSWTADAMARGYVTGKWYDTLEMTDYALPEMGLKEVDANERVGWDLYLGVTYLR